MMRNLGSGLPPRHPYFSFTGSGGGKRGPKDYSPLSWKDYFDTYQDIEIPEISSTFRVYQSGFNDEKIDGNKTFKYQDKPLLVLLHGGGYSGLSWATFVKELRELVFVKVAAIDIRGHGSTKTNNDEDLSIETLARDVGLVCQQLITDEGTRVVLMGHSMGGAIAVRSSVLCKELTDYISGLVVIDVVEGTALEALQGMQSFLRGRPSEFPSLENAIEWSVRSGQTKNLESARISMPSQLTLLQSTSDEPDAGQSAFLQGIHSIQEDEEEPLQPKECHSQDQSHSDQEQSNKSSSIKYKFKIDLTKTEVYWRGWFEGLSDQFLLSPSPAKLLLLAGIDRLDRPLTVGQMQGKFQMQVLPQCGHAVHEDVPDKVS